MKKDISTLKKRKFIKIFFSQVVGSYSFLIFTKNHKYNFVGCFTLYFHDRLINRLLYLLLFSIKSQNFHKFTQKLKGVNFQKFTKSQNSQNSQIFKKSQNFLKITKFSQKKLKKIISTLKIRKYLKYLFSQVVGCYSF